MRNTNIIGGKWVACRMAVVGVALAAVAAMVPAVAQPMVAPAPPAAGVDSGSPPGQFGIWHFLGSEQDKATVAVPPSQGTSKSIFVPSICAGAYPPPGCQTSVSKYEPGQRNWFGTGG